VDDLGDLGYVLKKLTSFMHKKYNIKPIVILDEYDTPIHRAYEEGYGKKMIDFMHGLMGEAFKGNDDLDKAIMTGITRVAQQSFSSSLNNLKAYTLLDKKYAQYFGFTQEELVQLVRDRPSINIASLEAWYNGYQIGGVKLYNPWSIMKCLKNEGILDNYWKHTSSNALVYKLIHEAGIDMSEDFENLILTKSCKTIINPHLTFTYLNKDEEAIWTLLLQTGYLTILSQKNSISDRIECVLKVPNKEVMFIYKEVTNKWFEEAIPKSYIKFVESLVNEDMVTFFTFIKKYMISSSSYFDFSKNTKEQVFHTFILGIFTNFIDTYDVFSNKEAGIGRYDMILIPKNKKQKGFIFEFKVCNKTEDLQNSSLNAIKQIKTKQYAVALKRVNRIMIIGLSFCGLECHGEYEIINRQ